MIVEIIAACITAGGAVAAAWIDRDRFRHKRHVDSGDLQKADRVIVAQRKVIARQRLEILSLRKYLNGTYRDTYIE